MSMKGPSPFALRVIRPLVHAPMSVPQLCIYTGFPERTVRSQIEQLRRAGAVRYVERIPPGRQGGSFALYRLEVIQL